MNYKEFIQQAVIAQLPGLWPVTIDSPTEEHLIQAAKNAADRLVEEGLLDPPVSKLRSDGHKKIVESDLVVGKRFLTKDCISKVIGIDNGQACLEQSPPIGPTTATWVVIRDALATLNFYGATELPAKSCDKACGPSDYEPGGICGRNGCYKPKPDEITWLDVVRGKTFQAPGDYPYEITDVKGGVVYWYAQGYASGHTPTNEFIRNMNAVGAKEVKL